MYHTLDTQKSMKPLFGHPVSNVHTEVIFMLNANIDLTCSTSKLVTSVSLTLIEIRRVNPVLSHHRHIKLKRNTCAYRSIFNAKCNNDLTDSETST